VYLRSGIRSSVSILCALLVCISGKEKISVSKSDALNVSAVAAACEESYRTGLPVQLSLSNDVHDSLVNGDVVVT